MDFHINDFKWSPDGTKIALEHQPDPLINSFFHSDISIFEVGTGTMQAIVEHPSSDSFRDWSPDSKSILYSTNLADSTSNYYKNDLFFRIDIDGGNERQLAADFDENIYGLRWTQAGIFGTAWQKTSRPVVTIDPENGATDILKGDLDLIWQLSFDRSGEGLVYIGRNHNGLSEIHKTDSNFKKQK